MTEQAEDEGLWVRSELLPDGTYGVGISVEADTAFVLDREQAVAYAVACFARATEADHDTAIMRLLTAEVGVPNEVAAQVVQNDLRPDRPDDHATDPLRFIPAVGRAKYPRPNAGAFIPILAMQLNGDQVGQLTPADLRDHGGAVLDVLAAADLDAALHRALVGTVGLDDDKARSVVGELSHHLSEPEPPRRSS